MILAVSIQKGGTGKTTTAAAIAQAAAYQGRRVLAVDLDPQGNLSFTLDAYTGEGTGNSYDLLTQSRRPLQIQTTPQDLDIIPASPDLSALSSGPGSARRLQRALEPLKNEYDLIIIDTPPTAGELQYNALQAADGLIIPLLADAYNIQSLYQITDTARQIRHSNPGLKILGVVFTQYDGRSTLTRQMREMITAKAESLGAPYLGTVRAGVAVKEAAALRKSLFSYAPKSKPAADYLEIYNKIMEEE